MSERRAWWVAVMLAGVILTASMAHAEPCGTRRKHPKRWAHVVWIWLENHGFDDIIGSPSAPYLNGLADACGLATNFHNTTHFSLPNYLGVPNIVDGLPSNQPM